jgi:predicted nucleic acid-binding protein
VPLPFLDTNVFVRHVAGDHAEFSPRARSLIRCIENEGLRVRTSETVVFESVFTLNRSYKMSKPAVRDAMRMLLSLRGISLPDKATVLEALDLFADRNMSFGDAYHAALMQRLGLTEVYSFDGDFDRVPGITRLEP